MQKRKIDVLVTFYNQDKYVNRALDSVFKQRCNFEFNVLVGDDGSKDNTVAIVNEWIKKYPGKIMLFNMERQAEEHYVGGFRASQNRLNLLKNVVSEYFIFLDGDDFFSDREKFQKQVDILDNPQNADCVACSHDIDAMFPDGTIKRYSSMTTCEGKYDLKKYWSNLYFHTDTTLVRSSVISSISFTLLENNFNDNLITYSIMQLGKIYYIPREMAVYDQTGEGIWTGEKAIVNHIRNMFLYDFCIKINSKFRYQTDIRFIGTWINLFKMRKKIDIKSFRELYDEATDKKLKYSLLWLNYNRISIRKKLLLYFNFCKIILEKFAYMIPRLPFKFARKGYNALVIMRKFVRGIGIQHLWMKGSKVQRDFHCESVDKSIQEHDNELGISIAPVYENRKGIVTIISDDGDYNTSILLNKFAKKNSVPITIAGTVENVAPHLKYWGKLIKEGNIELVNHSYNHYRMDEKWKYSKNKKKLTHEIVHSRLFFERRLGIKQSVFVCPENVICKLGYDVIRDDNIIAVRRGTRGLNSLDIKDGFAPGEWMNLMSYGIMDKPLYNKSKEKMREEWLKKTAQGKWLIEMWHNVEQNGYQTIDKKSAEEHIRKIAKYRDEENLWCAKFTDATAYLKEKELAKIHSWEENGMICIYIEVKGLPNYFNLHKLTLVINNKELASKEVIDRNRFREHKTISVYPNKMYYFKNGI